MFVAKPRKAEKHKQIFFGNSDGQKVESGKLSKCDTSHQTGY
jgi:hypothetical protein